MRLKQIKLAGFKSFVDPTTVPFPDQMTAIVGPNGCGKSNVIDAVRWVLGESSAKNLRGDAMIDVIFNGSTNRKPVSQASVELVFDNSEGRLEGSMANRAEISVKRQVNKEAQSSYFLNGSKCRRRDITDIFLGTGLGPRSYAIIEQGMISRLIESKPQELRVFIEEAAGISKYKERRRETENRIRHTRDNLERLQDVREELGTQLEKLKRQSATAKRFKELKSQERLYKAQLYALKWHKYNSQLNLYEKDRLAQETKLEAFMAEQRGGELSLLKLKQQQQQAADVATEQQQMVFQTGNQLTRIEQQILHSQQRLSEQQDEQVQLKQVLAESEEHLTFEQDRLEELLESQDELMPEVDLTQEQLLHSEELLAAAQQQLRRWQQGWQTKQSQFQQYQQQVQLITTKLQSLQTQITREQQRQSDLKAEIEELQALDNQASITEQESAKAAKQASVAELEEILTTETVALKQLIQALNQTQQDEQAQQQQVLAFEMELKHLKQWHKKWQANTSGVVAELLQQQGVTSLGSLLNQLEVEASWQSAIQGLLSYAGDPVLVSRLPELSELSSGQLLLSQNSQEPVRADSLASAVLKGQFPSWFNQVVLVDSVEQGQKRLADENWHSALTQSGLWFGDNWQNIGCNSKLTDSDHLTKLTRMGQVELELEQNQQAHAKLLSQSAQVKQQVQQQESELKQLQQRLQTEQLALSELDVELRLMSQQQQQTTSLITKAEDDIAQIELRLAQEADIQFELEQELEMISAQQLELETEVTDLESEQNRHQEDVTSAQSQVEQYKNKSHQLALQLQNVQSQVTHLQQNLQRANTHQQQVKQKLEQLNERLTQGDEPIVELKMQQEGLLHQRLEMEQVLIDKQNLSAELSEKIADLEQGQSGVLAKLEQMRETIANIKLDEEGARVRAQNMLDTLSEMQQPLKPVLEQMPAEAQEQEWSERLDKTSAAIGRLGAINLAAIDEYEIQSERKRYLDEQFDDLIGALETLESAIRKIDKESRLKFKETYDRVNQDLQTLFPKVFGGGSAYLELTADDMLDTGVTIMARPPGKKNSTIHLLSGGEKALTALSLVFSIFRLNPAPFCMLDEVDAPLDDANVGRFCNLVKEMSDTVQFIFISHNKVAMEMATHLTGVTMQEPGVSRLVAVDIQEAVKMAEAS